MWKFFPDRGGFTHKESYGYDPERFLHSFALILLVDLIHGNFLIGPKICLHLLVFQAYNANLVN